MNKIENPEINPHCYSQLMFDRRRKHMQWAKDSLFNKWCWENQTDTCRKNETRLPSYATHENSKWIKDLNVRPETIKILEESTAVKISDTAHSNIVSDIAPWARITKE